jgi:hypothetical protein
VPFGSQLISKTRVARFLLVQHTNMGKTIPNDYKNTTYICSHKNTYIIAIKLPTFLISSPSKIFSNWDFGYAKTPSGNPVKDTVL